MLTRYERKTYWRYAANLFRFWPNPRRLDQRQFMDFECMLEYARYPSEWRSLVGSHDSGSKPPVHTRQKTLAELAHAELRALGHVPTSAQRRKLETLGTMFGLDKLSIDLLELLFMMDSMEPVRDLQSSARNLSSSSSRPLAMMLGSSAVAVEKRMDSGGSLVYSGLLDVQSPNRWEAALQLSVRLRGLLAQRASKPVDIRRVLMGNPTKGGLEWEDFSHLGDDRDFLHQLFRTASRKRERGIHVLLYGASGSGKTEFAKTLSARLSLAMYEVPFNEGPDFISSASRRALLAQMFQTLLSGSPGTCLLLDEADNILGSSRPGSSSFFGGYSDDNHNSDKAFLNHLLESAPTPMIWICNHATGIDPALLRRFSFVLEMNAPTRRIREQIWSRNLRKRDIGEHESLARSLSHYEVTPGIAAQAVRAASLTDRSSESIERVVVSISRVTSTRLPSHHSAQTIPFSTHLINCPDDIGELTRTLKSSPGRNFSLCLHGPPGTGKSAWLRQLAEEMHMEVSPVRASDILSKWLGESEGNIARAFTDAEKQRSFLIFDEADSLLSDRQGAQRSWEVTQVNEMLTWMERHPLPFACSTNLMENLDRAAMRRFTFKLKFDYLTPAQAQKAFQLFFDLAPPRGARLPSHLTPGDFEVVRRKAELTGGKSTYQLVRWLEAESEVKSECSRSIGFL